MLKTLAFIGAVAALAPAAAHAQPWWQDQGGYQQRYDGYDRYDRGDYRYNRRDYGHGRDDRRYERQAYGYGGVPYVLGHPAYDEYGPDPNGLIAADGHRIKCKLVDQWDEYGRSYRRRSCW